MGKKSDARATLESSVISGLSERADLTSASSEYAHIQVPDILDAIFHPSVVWAVREYLKEIDTYEDATPETAAQRHTLLAMAQEMLEEICRLCRILNPQHADCNWCQGTDAWRRAIEGATKDTTPAAPEMLAALETIEQWCVEWQDVGRVPIGRLLRVTRPAIAKAKLAQI